jgi:ABC-type branched-subunit amino acid transport system substrate-binding protein
MRQAGALAAAGALIFGLTSGSSSASMAKQQMSASNRASTERPANSKNPLNVALTTDLTGEDAPARKPFNEGVVAFFKTHPTIAGRPIKVHIFDGQDNPAIAPAVFRQAVSSHPVAIIDFVLSTSLQAAEPVLASAGIPCLCEGGPDSWYGPKPYPWVFIANPTIGDQVRAYAAAMKKVLGGTLQGKRIAISGDKTALLALEASEFKALVLREGATVVSTQFGDTSETSWSGQAAQIAQAKPDGIFEDTIGSAEIVQLKALETAGLTKTPIVAFPGLQYNDITSLKLPNVFTVTSWPYGTPSNSAVYKAAKKLGYLADEISYEFEFGWSQAALLAQALTNCNACSGAKLEATLEHIKNFRVPGDASFGPISFSKTTHAVNLEEALVAWNPRKNSLQTTLLGS